jgi:hypothetical protein
VGPHGCSRSLHHRCCGKGWQRSSVSLAPTTRPADAAALVMMVLFSRTAPLRPSGASSSTVDGGPGEAPTWLRLSAPAARGDAA